MLEPLGAPPNEKYVFRLFLFVYGLYVKHCFSPYDSPPLLMLSEMELQTIREVRNKMRLPESLITLTIKTVAKHCTRFIDAPDSPLKCLRKWEKTRPLNGT